MPVSEYLHGILPSNLLRTLFRFDSADIPGNSSCTPERWTVFISNWRNIAYEAAGVAPGPVLQLDSQDLDRAADLRRHEKPQVNDSRER